MATESKVRLIPELEVLRGRPGARITVVRSGGLGDTILLLPTLGLLHAALPDARLTLLGSAWAEQLGPLLPGPVRVARFDAPALAPLFGGEASRDPTGLFSGSDAVILYAADPTSAFAHNAARHCRGPVIAWPVVPPDGTHAARHFARAVLEATPGVPDLPMPSLRVGSDLAAWAEAWIADRLGTGARPLAIHPGSGGRRKCWPGRRLRRGGPRARRSRAPARRTGPTRRRPPKSRAASPRGASWPAPSRSTCPGSRLSWPAAGSPSATTAG